MTKSILKLQLVVMLLYSFNFVHSQNIVIIGAVTDSLKTPLQYVNIGIYNKAIGTVTDVKGNFFLNINNSMYNDTLKVSSLGYKSKEILIKNILSNQKTNIILDSFIEELEEVVLTSNNIKTFIKGKKKSKSKNEVFFAIPKAKNQNLGSEIGREFSIGSKKPSLLKEFKFFIKKNNFDKVKFRIKLYTIKDEFPYKNINKENIFIEVKNKSTGWITIDLSEYDISIQQDIIITAEWIEGSTNGDKLSLPMLIPSFNSIHFYKYGSQAKWKKYKMISTAMILTYEQ